MERSLKSDPEPDNKEDSWPFRPLGERVAAGSRAYSKKHLIAFFLFSELDQFTELALVRVTSKECVAPVPNLGLILHYLKHFFCFFHQHRQLLKDSFMVELVEGARKLRHVFLFTDLFLCAKLKKQIGG